MLDVVCGFVVLAVGAFLGYLFGWVRGWHSASQLRDEMEGAVHGASPMLSDLLPDVPDLPEATAESDYLDSAWKRAGLSGRPIPPPPCIAGKFPR